MQASDHVADSRLAALHRAVEACYPRLLARARRLLVPRRTFPLEADDLVSEAYAAAHRWVVSTDREIEEERLEGLLMKILHRRFLDAARVAGRRLAAEVPLDVAAAVAAPPPVAVLCSPTWDRALAELRTAVHDGRVDISPRQLAALRRALERRQAGTHAAAMTARNAAERQNASRGARAVLGWLQANGVDGGLPNGGRRQDAVAQLQAIGVLPFLTAHGRDQTPEEAA